MRLSTLNDRRNTPSKETSANLDANRRATHNVEPVLVASTLHIPVATVSRPNLPNLQEVAAVISDFDDTILDNGNAAKDGLHELSRQHALQEVGIQEGIDLLTKLTPEMSMAAITNAPSHISEGAFWWLLCEMGVIPSYEAYDPTHELIQALARSKNKHYKNLLITKAKEIPGAQSFFQSLYDSGFKERLAIASSGHRDDINLFLGEHGFGHIFNKHSIITQADVDNLKPHPEAYLKAAQSLGIDPNTHLILAFEDDPKGIIAAKRAGLLTYAVTTRYSKKQLLSQAIPPDFVANDFNDYIRLFHLTPTSNKDALPTVVAS